MPNFTMRVTVDIDVQNAENTSEAREAVFSLLSSPKSETTKRGRPSSSNKARAIVTGIQIPQPESIAISSADVVKCLSQSGVEVTETTP